MESLQLQNQIYTMFCAICNIPYMVPYMVYWLIGFTFNMYWLSAMFMIVYKSNIYNDLLNKKYFDCLSVIVPQIYYLYGVLTWNPMIICVIMLHSIIIGNNIYTVTYGLIKEVSEFDFNMKFYVTPTDEPAEPEEDEPEEDEPAAPEEDEPEEDEPAAPEEDEHAEPDDTPVVISVTEEQHVDVSQ